MAEYKADLKDNQSENVSGLPGSSVNADIGQKKDDLLTEELFDINKIDIDKITKEQRAEKLKKLQELSQLKSVRSQLKDDPKYKDMKSTMNHTIAFGSSMFGSSMHWCQKLNKINNLDGRGKDIENHDVK